MNNPTRNLLCAGAALAVLVASDVASMTGSLPGSQSRRLSAQETGVWSRENEEQTYLEARRAVNRDDCDRAAELFRTLRTEYDEAAGGRFIADSYYWEAFCSHRAGDLDEALALLDLAGVHREARKYVLEGGYQRPGRVYQEVRDLRLRIRRQLAEQGDPDAAEEVLRQSEAVLARDTAAWREAQEELEARHRELLRQWQEEQARAERMWQEEQARTARMWQEQLARYQALDSTEIQEILRQPERMAQLAGAMAALADTAAVPIAGIARRPFMPGVYLNERGVLVNSPEVASYFATRFNPVPDAADIHPECVDALIEQEALTALLRVPTDRLSTARGILERRDDCSGHLRHLVVHWLAGTDTDEARQLLVDVAREHPDPDTRQLAVTRLAYVKTPEAAEVLVNILREARDRQMQDAAISGLYHHQTEEASQALIDFAADGSKPELQRQRAAVLVAERLSPELLQTVFGRFDDYNVQHAFLEIVGARAEHGEHGVTSWLLPVIVDGEHPERVRAEALRAWARQPSLDLERVEETYNRLESAELRDQFLYALYQTIESDEENADAIIDKMIELAREETDPEVRRRVIYWLGRTGSDRAAAFLVEILRNGFDRLPAP